MNRELFMKLNHEWGKKEQAVEQTLCPCFGLERRPVGVAVERVLDRPWWLALLVVVMTTRLDCSSSRVLLGAISDRSISDISKHKSSTLSSAQLEV